MSSTDHADIKIIVEIDRLGFQNRLRIFHAKMKLRLRFTYKLVHMIHILNQ